VQLPALPQSSCPNVHIIIFKEPSISPIHLVVFEKNAKASADILRTRSGEGVNYTRFCVDVFFAFVPVKSAAEKKLTNCLNIPGGNPCKEKSFGHQGL